MPDVHKPEAQVIVDAARRGAELTFLDAANNHLAFVPDLGRGEFVSLEQFQAAPLRKRGNVTVYDALSLNKLIADNFEPGQATIYCDRDPERPSIVAVLNGAGPNGPGWSDARITLAFRPTPQWIKWRAIDGRLMPQVEFAEFIEDNLEDVAEPPGATMLEIASYLQATRTADFKSGINLSTGAVQLMNLEDVSAQVGSSAMVVPSEFRLAIRPVFGSNLYSVPVRFRFRVSGGKLSLGVKLQRMEDLMMDVLNDVVAAIEPREGMTIVDGTPPVLAR